MARSKYIDDSLLLGQMHERAAFWVARLRADDCSETDLQDFALWLNANPEHRSAMDSMLDMWDDLAVLEHLPASVVSAPLEDARLTRRQWLGAGLATAACTLFALLLLPLQQEAQQPELYETSVGSQQLVELADGSRVTLNTDSKIVTLLDEDMRLVTLDKGEAYFEVVKDPDGRPFVVDVGTAEVRVMGTAFNIYRQGDNSNITVTEGVVRVTEKGQAGNRAASSELLYPAQTISSSEAGLSQAGKVDMANHTAWREGKIVAQAMPLSELLQEIARYHDKKILVADPELGQKTVSGVFSLDDPQAIVSALEHSMGVQSLPLEDNSILLIRASL